MVVDPVNQTIQAVNGTGILSNVAQANFFTLVIDRFMQIVAAPFTNPEMMWIVTPLIITLVVIQLYFGRYIKEKLSWDSATCNALALAFVSADLLRHIYMSYTNTPLYQIFLLEYEKIFLILIVATLGLWMMLVDFFHIMPESVGIFMSSPMQTSSIAYVTIATVYSNIAVDWITLISALMLWILLNIIFAVIKLFEPIAIPEEKTEAPSPKEHKEHKDSKKR